MQQAVEDKTRIAEKKISEVRKGFTLIEISLSMAIIGVLSVVVMLLISNAVSAYHKGLTLNQLNTVGMNLVEDIRVAIQNSPAKSIADECVTLYQASEEAEAGAQTKCSEDDAASFVTQVRIGNVKVNGNDYSNMPLGGIFCTGKYTYIWNSGYLINEEMGMGISTLQLKYKTIEGEGTTDEKARLLKIHDENRMICKTTAGYRMASNSQGEPSRYIKASDEPLAQYGSNMIDISKITTLDEAPEDLLEENGGLAVYDFEVTQPAVVENLDVMFYSASMILGTLRGGPDITIANDNCKTPAKLDADFDYCAINKFNFAARAAGGAKAF